MNVLALCSGIGGLELGLHMATGGRARAVCHVERDAYAACVLMARMEDESLERAPIWDDLATFDARPWRGVVDCVTAGFPCQPWSVAGKRKGTADARWIWPDIARIIGECQPGLVFIENVPGLYRHGLRAVLSDLAALGFDAEWTSVRASDVGAPHRRERVFILAYRDSAVWNESGRWDGACGSSAAEPGHAGEPMADGDGISTGWPTEREGARLGRGSDKCGAAMADSARLPGGERSGRERVLHDGAAVADAIGCGHDGRTCDTEREAGGRAAAQGPDSTVGEPVSTRREAPGRSAQHAGGEPCEGHRLVGNSHEPGLEGRGLCGCGRAHELPAWPPGPSDTDGWREYLRAGGPEPAIRRGADGLPDRMDRLRCLGNAVVPQQAALAFRLLLERISS